MCCDLVCRPSAPRAAPQLVQSQQRRVLRNTIVLDRNRSRFMMDGDLYCVDAFSPISGLPEIGFI
jgi:hypothetical protein